MESPIAISMPCSAKSRESGQAAAAAEKNQKWAAALLFRNGADIKLRIFTATDDVTLLSRTCTHTDTLHHNKV